MNPINPQTHAHLCETELLFSDHLERLKLEQELDKVAYEKLNAEVYALKQRLLHMSAFLGPDAVEPPL